jgi:hypothetical protein
MILICRFHNLNTKMQSCNSCCLRTDETYFKNRVCKSEFFKGLTVDESNMHSQRCLGSKYSHLAWRSGVAVHITFDFQAEPPAAAVAASPREQRWMNSMDGCEMKGALLSGWDETKKRKARQAGKGEGKRISAQITSNRPFPSLVTTSCHVHHYTTLPPSPRRRGQGWKIEGGSHQGDKPTKL